MNAQVRIRCSCLEVLLRQPMLEIVRRKSKLVAFFVAMILQDWTEVVAHKHAGLSESVCLHECFVGAHEMSFRNAHVAVGCHWMQGRLLLDAIGCIHSFIGCIRSFIGCIHSFIGCKAGCCRMSLDARDVC